MTTTYPSIDELKAQAKRLRQAIAGRGNELAHSAALELLARQYGLRDWNTLSALAAKPNAASAAEPPFGVGSAVRGRYLSQPFTGKVLALSAQPGGLYRITIHFDEPVDVVTFESFSAFRRRINAQVDADGVSPRKTSDGVPHLVLDI
ncbi:MAG: glyoxalase superfamily protein [Rhizobium sp.]